MTKEEENRKENISENSFEDESKVKKRLIRFNHDSERLISLERYIDEKLEKTLSL